MPNLGTVEVTVVPVLEQQYASFVKREPVVLTHLLGAPILGAVTLLAPGDASGHAEQITAAAVTLAILLQGFVVRRFVTPTWQKFTVKRPMPGPGVYAAPNKLRR